MSLGLRLVKLWVLVCPLPGCPAVQPGGLGQLNVVAAWTAAAETTSHVNTTVRKTTAGEGGQHPMGRHLAGSEPPRFSRRELRGLFSLAVSSHNSLHLNDLTMYPR